MIRHTTPSYEINCFLSQVHDVIDDFNTYVSTPAHSSGDSSSHAPCQGPGTPRLLQLHLHPALALICSFLTLFVCETFPVSRLLSSLALHASLLRHSISSTTVAYALLVSIFLQDFCERLHTEVDISAPRFLSLAPIGLLVGSALVSRLHAATTSLLSCALFPLALPTSQLPPPVCLPLKPSEPGPSTCSPAAARRITTLARRLAVQTLRTSLQSSCVIERANAAHLAATRRAHLLGPTRAADYGLISSALQPCRVATPPQTRFRLSRLGSGNPLRTPRTPSAPENVFFQARPACSCSAFLFAFPSSLESPLPLLCLLCFPPRLTELPPLSPICSAQNVGINSAVPQ